MRHFTAFLFFLAFVPLAAQVPQIISYQGRVLVGNTLFEGVGQFKFALVNTDGTTTYWSNDGSGAAGSQPAAAVPLAVTRGLYSVLLGDASLPNMTPVLPAVFSQPDVRLRVWFNDGVNGFQQLTPDQRVAAAGYALQAAGMTGVTHVDGRVGIGTASPQAELEVAGALRLGPGSTTPSAGLLRLHSGSLQAHDGTRWRTLLDSAPSVMDFGAKGDGVTDDTAAIQAAVDHSAAVRAAIRLPRGTYRVTTLFLKSQARLVGESMSGTILRALPGSAAGLLQLPAGPVVRVRLENLTLSGGVSAPENPGQWAIHAEAAPTVGAPFHGGMWDSTFENIRVSQFTHGFWFKGGDSDTLLPHQFIKFDMVRIDRSNAAGTAFKATGQCEHFTHSGCLYQAVGGTTTGTNVQLLRENPAGPGPSSQIFMDCTFQNSDKAVEIQGGENLSFLNCWFENIARSLTATVASRALLVENCRFANAANGGGTGYVLYSDNSHCALRDNVITGATDKVVTAATPLAYIESSGNHVSGTPASLTTGMTKQVGVSGGGEVTLNEGSTFLVNTSATSITTIHSKKLPGESVFLRAHSGPIQFATSGNISLGSAASPLVIPQNQVVQLVRFDLGGTWMVIGK